MRVPRPVKWALVGLGLLAGWSAGHLLDLHSANGGAEAGRPPAHPPASVVAPATAPATMPAVRE